jgi:hypothetical protein
MKLPVSESTDKGIFLVAPNQCAGRTTAIEGCAAMLEEVLSDLARAFAAGLLTGGAFVAMRGSALRAVHQYLRRPRRRDQRNSIYAERRLAAIVSVDVVGYSRLMNADEEGTHARLQSCRRTIIVRKFMNIAVASSKTPAMGLSLNSAVPSMPCVALWTCSKP